MTTEETPLNSARSAGKLCRGSESPQRRNSESGSTGYSTDYSTFEVSRRSSVQRGTLPTRFISDNDGEWSSYQRRPMGTGHSPDNDAGVTENVRIASGHSALGLDGVRDMKEVEEEKEDMMREEPHCLPTTVNCSLIPSCAFHHCKNHSSPSPPSLSLSLYNSPRIPATGAVLLF